MMIDGKHTYFHEVLLLFRKEIAELRQLILTVCTGGGGGVRGIDSSAGVTGGGGSTDRTAGSIEQSAGRRTKRPSEFKPQFCFFNDVFGFLTEIFALSFIP